MVPNKHQLNSQAYEYFTLVAICHLRIHGCVVMHMETESEVSISVVLEKVNHPKPSFELRSSRKSWFVRRRALIVQFERSQPLFVCFLKSTIADSLFKK